MGHRTWLAPRCGSLIQDARFATLQLAPFQWKMAGLHTRLLQRTLRIEKGPAQALRSKPLRVDPFIFPRGGLGSEMKLRPGSMHQRNEYDQIRIGRRPAGMLSQGQGAAVVWPMIDEPVSGFCFLFLLCLVWFPCLPRVDCSPASPAFRAHVLIPFA